MADVRPLRATRRTVQALGHLKENAVANNMVRKAAPLQHVRSTLGEISNKSTAQTITIGKGGLAPVTKPTGISGISSMKENALVGRGKATVVGKLAKPVVEQKTGLSLKEKPATTKPGVIRRITNIVNNTSVVPAKPKVSSTVTSMVAPKPIMRVKPLQAKPKEEIVKKDAVAAPISAPSIDVSVFSRAEIKEFEGLDLDDKSDAFSAAEYVKDIYHYLRDLEVVYSVPVGYIKQCKQMTFHMRAVLIDWIVGVHRQFKLMPETLYLAVSIFDRYMPAALATPKSQLQLVGITSLLVAAKYEEIMCPTVADCVYVTDNTYTGKQVADMEMKILNALNFNIGRPLPLHFLRRFTKTGDASYEDHSTAKYFMELQLVRHEMCHVAPSLQAASALSLSLWLNNEDKSASLKDLWSPALHYFSGYSFAEVEEAVKTLAVVVVKGHTSSLQAVRKKFASKSQAEISHFVEGQLDRIKSLVL